MKHSRIVLSVAAAAAIAVVTQLTACTIAVIGGVAGAGTLIATAGRRSSETAQADDRIEKQAGDAIEQELNGRNHHVTVTSYYRMVLLTGEVTAENDRARAQILAQGVEGVRGVYNDLVVMPPAGVLSRSQDAYITSKVRAHLIHANGVPAASVKVLTERGTVYLMGRLTYQEAQTTTKAIQQVDGVQRVARIIDFIPDTAAIDSSTSTVTSDDSDVAVDAVTSPPAPSDAEARPITQPDIQPSP